MALLTSALVSRLALTSSWFAAGEMKGGTCGGGLLRISWKCSAHLALFLASPAMVWLFLSFTGLQGALFFPDSVLTCDLIRPLHVSFASCCFCFFCEVMYEAPLVRSGAFLDLSVQLPVLGL